MKTSTLIILICISVSCFADQLSNEQLTTDTTQRTLLESGINLEECIFLKEKLRMDVDSCDLLKAHYVPFMFRAMEIKNKLPEIMRIGPKQASVEKIANILKEFPETTNKEMYDMLMDTKK